MFNTLVCSPPHRRFPFPSLKWVNNATKPFDLNFSIRYLGESLKNYFSIFLDVVSTV